MTAFLKEKGFKEEEITTHLSDNGIILRAIALQDELFSLQSSQYMDIPENQTQVTELQKKQARLFAEKFPFMCFNQDTDEDNTDEEIESVNPPKIFGVQKLEETTDHSKLITGEYQAEHDGSIVSWYIYPNGEILVYVGGYGYTNKFKNTFCLQIDADGKVREDILIAEGQSEMVKRYRS